MGLDAPVRLNCLLFSSPHDVLATLVRACAPPSATPALLREDDPVQLATALATHNIDVVFVAGGINHDGLPDCLTAYPDLPVVVVMSADCAKPLPTLLEHGASEVISGESEYHLKSELARILCEHTLRKELNRTKRQLESQMTLRQVLLDNHSHAVMLWQQSSVRQANRQFERLINCTQHAAMTLHWRRWMSAETAHLMEDLQTPSSLQTIITNADKSQYKASIETVMLEGGPACLLQIDPAPVQLEETQVSNLDSSAIIPSRRAFTENLQVWLRALKPHTRFVAMSIRLPDIRSRSGSQGIDETLQDLLVHRASNLLEQNAGRTTVIGKTDNHSLLLVQLQNKSDARSAALSIRALLGTLGGLIDNPRTISIKTLTSSACAMGAYEVLWRLESGHQTLIRMSARDQSEAIEDRRRASLPSAKHLADTPCTTPSTRPPEVLQFAHPTAGA